MKFKIGGTQFDIYRYRRFFGSWWINIRREYGTITSRPVCVMWWPAWDEFPTGEEE